MKHEAELAHTGCAAAMARQSAAARSFFKTPLLFYPEPAQKLRHARACRRGDHLVEHIARRRSGIDFIQHATAPVARRIVSEARGRVDRTRCSDRAKYIRPGESGVDI